MNRINPPTCICPDGTYDAGTVECPKCNIQCLRCSTGSPTLCIQCRGNRILPPKCTWKYQLNINNISVNFLIGQCPLGTY